MKLSNFKKILIIILFFLFFVIIDNKCFAWTNSSIEDINSTLSLINFSSICEDCGVEIEKISNLFVISYGYRLDFYFFSDNVNITISGNSPSYRLSINYCSIISYFTQSNIIQTYNFSNNFTISSSATIDNYVQKIFSTQDIYYNNTLFFSDCGDYINGSIYENGYTPLPPIVYETPTLYIDDMNFRKRFKFQFNIPMVRDDTKYYVFLEDYNRISYSSVSATFRIFTVTTPEGYDYTDYENFMYYDNRLKDTNLILPAGCEIHEFSTICSNNNVAELNEIQTYTASRLHFNISVFLELQRLMAYTYNTFDDNTFVNYYNYLYPTDYYISDEINYSFSHFISSLLNTFTFDTIYSTFENIFSNYFNDVTISNQNHYSYYSSLLLHYYSDYKSYNFYKFNFNDFVFSNGCIVSYEPKKYDSNLYGTIYNLYRKTKVYNQNNKIEDIGYIFNYTDSEDVSSMLPSGTSVEYLTSPFYRDNESSSSGGYITYDINEILQGDKIIDYSKEDNSIHNNFNADYIENYTEGDNIVINNYYTNEIDKTSDDHLLHNIYLAILEIKLKLSDIGDSISNTTNNFTYNTENTVKYYFIPNSYAMDSIKEELQDTAAEHLGIIYQPFQRHTIYFYCYFWYCY